MNGSPDADIAVFTEALCLSSEERNHFLSEACQGDAEFRRRVEALLEAYEQAGDFLGRPAADRPAGAVQASAGEKPGDRIGHYRLLQQIGEGGYGVVYMAEQEAPIRRRVALKIIKAGMDTKAVIARFEAERQALALMNHPNIAKVFDAGSTESGRPYFVMELVRGVKITQYCDQHSLTTEDRLGLFVRVCQAVQHAHQRGIIHRDIKPSNILVTQSLGRLAMPVVIDFGVAKAAKGQPLTDKTVFTAFEMLIGTPAYMSPEQAALSIAEVDTRTDIYSLGVLLYELLTGTTPFDTHELLKSGLDEVRRVIRDQPPVRPSTRLSTMLEANLNSLSRQRRAEPPKLIREVEGDLDWIVMKALEKDRNRRYQTANGIAEDLQRFLANDAISARPPSYSYRLLKLIQRNKGLFGALAAVGAVLIVALVAVSLALTKEAAARRVANRAQLQAEDDRDKSHEVVLFLKEMLDGVAPAVASGRDTALLRDILDKTAARLDTSLANQPEAQADLRYQLGRTYRELEEYPRAEAMLRQALAIRARLFGDDSQPTSDIRNDLGDVLATEGKCPEGEALIRKALAARLKTLGDRDVKVARSYLQLGSALFNERRYAEAETAVRESLRSYTNAFGDHDTILSDPLASLGSVLFVQGKYRQAEETFRGAMNIALPEGQASLRVVGIQSHLAVVLAQLGKFSEAEALLRQSVEERRKIFKPDHPMYITALRQLAGLLMQEGKYADAEGFLRELLPLERAHNGDASPWAINSLQNLLFSLTAQRKTGDADALVAELLPPGLEMKPKNFGLLRVRREFLARRGHWKEAAADAALLIEKGSNDSDSYHSLMPLLVALNQMDNYQNNCRKIMVQFGGTTNVYDADRMAKDCLILPLPGVDLGSVAAMARTAVTGTKTWQAFPFFQCCKALAEYRQGHFEEAMAWARDPSQQPHPYFQAEGCAILAMAQQRLNQTNDARITLVKAEQIASEKLPRLESGDLGNDWRDWIIIHALLEQARTLIEVPVSP